MAKIKHKKGQHICLCASEEAHGKPSYIGSSYGHPIDGSGFRDDVYPFYGVCAKGYDNSDNGTGHTALGVSQSEFRNINIKSSVADFYMLEALATGLFASAHFPRPQAGVEPMNMLWRRQANHPGVVSLDGGMYQKPCGHNAFLTESGLLDPCEHDVEISDQMWEAYLDLQDPMRYLGPIVKEANKRQKKMVKDLKRLFLAYGIFAFASELHYFKGLPFCLGGWSADLVPAMDVIYDQLGASYLWREVERCFDPELNVWDSAYGGGAWANAAHVYLLHAQKKITDKIFVDRVFNLQHNTGTFLNKVSWEDYPGYASPVLESHRLSMWYTLHDSCTVEVKQLVDSYWDALNIQREKVQMDVVHPYHTQARYKYNGQCCDRWRRASRDGELCCDCNKCWACCPC